MLLPDNIESKLCFGRIRDAVCQYCKTDIGRESVGKMSFMTSFNDVERLTGQTAELAAILDAGLQFPSSELPDLREPLIRIRVEGLYLTEEELLSLRTSLVLTSEVIGFFEAQPEECYPRLRCLASELTTFPLTISQIDRVLDNHGVIKDHASLRLAEIRREIKTQEAQAAHRLAAILKKAQSEGIVEADAAISIRNGVAVIPIPTANKRRINGVVLDESATGRTAFIQPGEVMAINSLLQVLHNEERREIIKILKEITGNVRPCAPDIIHSAEILGIVDFVRAKAVYAKEIDAILPVIENRQGLYLSGARHPLLMLQLKSQGKKIVPLNIELEAPESRILLISGPNAGGKSVCLQTVGLLQYMLQCGLLIPVNDGSRMGVFNNLFIDIGDNQSIENDLSTYSSHLVAMKNFLRGADSKTMVLIDEFGTGTEPMLGGAIAESVLAELNRLGVYGVLTTHYTNLKHFASQTKGLTNAAMTFDTHKIEPLFALLIGQPGSSFAFEIARKIGLPENILQDAKEKMGQENADYDKNLRQIVRDKHYWEKKRQNVKENDKRLADILQKYNDILVSVKAERREILAKAKEEAKELLAEANKMIENTIKEIKESQADKEKTRIVREQLSAFKEETQKDLDVDNTAIEQKIEQIKRRQQRQRDKAAKRGEIVDGCGELPQNDVDTIPLQGGDYVNIDGDKDCVGQILSIKGSTAVVAIGNMSANMKTERLARVSRGEAHRQKTQQIIKVNTTNVSKTVREKKLNFSSEIDVRGMRADEALQRVAQFVDEAVICEAPQVRILHGKGNGILRQEIRQYLRSLPFVDDVRDENVQFGGAGITVVDL